MGTRDPSKAWGRGARGGFMRAFLVLLGLVLHATGQKNVVEVETMIPGVYTAPGIMQSKDSDCGSEDMDSPDPNADAMPHANKPFPELGALDTVELGKMMNTGGKAGKTAPKDRLHPHSHLTSKQQVPYTPAESTTAQRRPCNLDEAIATVRLVVADYEEERDAAFSTARFNASLESARKAVEAAGSAVEALERARVANETIYAHMAVLDAKGKLMYEKTIIKADLLETEGMVKAPLVVELGKIYIETAATLKSKNAALESFSSLANKSESDNKRTIDLYNKLLSNLKQQEAVKLGHVHQLLTPIQPDLNQTDAEINRLRSDIAVMQAEVQQLLPVALSYTQDNVLAARGILADTTAHYTSLREANKENMDAYGQRVLYRSTTEQMLMNLNSTLADILVPEEFHDQHAINWPEMMSAPELKPVAPRRGF